MGRALSVTALLSKKMSLLQFEDRFYDLIGCPQLTGTWIIWAPPGSGKTTFTLELCKYLTKFGRVAYDTLEEGASESFKKAIQRVNMKEVGTKFIILDKEPISELKERLRKKKAPKIVVIDSFQYAQINYNQYTEMVDEFRDTLFIIISHEESKKPEGRAAKKVWYDAMVKIRVDGYVAFSTSRYAVDVTRPYVIWEAGALKYHGSLDFNI
jgi:KaiC/GvpD/RAD55 family RecA-like ATPase